MKRLTSQRKKTIFLVVFVALGLAFLVGFRPINSLSQGKFSFAKIYAFEPFEWATAKISRSGVITISWKSATELSGMGYLVYRGTNYNGTIQYLKITSSPILVVGPPNNLGENIYKINDILNRSTLNCFYKIVAIDVKNGTVLGSIKTSIQ